MTSSMTGFGAAEGEIELNEDRTASWRWEIKGVNGKGLDIKLRMPSGLEALDQKIRPLISNAVARGTIHISLMLNRPGSEAELVIDERAFSTVLKMIGEIQKMTSCAPPQPEAILALKGVLTMGEAPDTDADKDALEAGLLSGLSEALDQFTTARSAEGNQLLGVLVTQIDTMCGLTTKAKDHAGTALPHHLEQMRAKISDLIGSQGIAEERLEQEAVLLAVRSDIREELDRLDGHLASVSELLASKGVIGRKLDFLAQELGREVNTLTSKAWTLDIKRIGLDLKLLVDQFREQVQNLE